MTPCGSGRARTRSSTPAPARDGSEPGTSRFREDVIVSATETQIETSESRRIADAMARNWAFTPPRAALLDPTPADGPDPYGNPDPEWLRIDWREHLRTGDVEGTRPKNARIGRRG